MSYRKVIEDFKSKFVDKPKDRCLYGWNKYEYRNGKSTDIIGLYLDKLSDTELLDIQGQDLPTIYEKIKKHLPVDDMSFWYHMQVLHDDVHTNFEYFYAKAQQYDLRDKLFDGQYLDLGYTYNWQSTAQTLGLPVFTDDGKRRLNWVIDKFCPDCQDLKLQCKEYGDWEKRGRYVTLISYNRGMPTGVSGW
jgi:hypothetical protein